LVAGFLFSGGASLNSFLGMAIIAFIGTVVTYYISIYVIDALATSFASEKDINKTAQLVAYSRTPGYLAGLLSFIPFLGLIIGILAWGYSIYIMYLGLGPLKKTPEDKKVVYLVVSFILLFVVNIVIAAILGMILLSTMGLGAASAGRFGM
ncbi:MAG: YIP1 family protein, partial [Chitinophagaceae bacterium]